MDLHTIKASIDNLSTLHAHIKVIHLPCILRGSLGTFQYIGRYRTYELVVGIYRGSQCNQYKHDHSASHSFLLRFVSLPIL